MDSRGLEETYTRESHAALIKHLGDRKYPFDFLIAAFAIGLIGAGLSVAVVLIAGGGFDLLYRAFVVGESVTVPQGTWLNAAAISLVVVATTARNASLKMLAPTWPMLAEYVGRNSIKFSLDEEDTDEKLTARARVRVEKAIRRGMVGAGRRFDPALFLRQESVRFRWTWLAVTIALMAVNIGLFLRAI